MQTLTRLILALAVVFLAVGATADYAYACKHLYVDKNGNVQGVGPDEVISSPPEVNAYKCASEPSRAKPEYGPLAIAAAASLGLASMVLVKKKASMWASGITIAFMFAALGYVWYAFV